MITAIRHAISKARLTAYLRARQGFLDIDTNGAAAGLPRHDIYEDARAITGKKPPPSRCVTHDAESMIAPCRR